MRPGGISRVSIDPRHAWSSPPEALRRAFLSDAAFSPGTAWPAPSRPQAAFNCPRSAPAGRCGSAPRKSPFRAPRSPTRASHAGEIGTRKLVAHNNSMEPTRPAAAKRVHASTEELAGRLVSRPLCAQKEFGTKQCSHGLVTHDLPLLGLRRSAEAQGAFWKAASGHAHCHPRRTLVCSRPARAR